MRALSLVLVILVTTTLVQAQNDALVRSFDGLAITGLEFQTASDGALVVDSWLLLEGRGARPVSLRLSFRDLRGKPFRAPRGAPSEFVGKKGEVTVSTTVTEVPGHETAITLMIPASAFGGRERPPKLRVFARAECGPLIAAAESEADLTGKGMDTRIFGIRRMDHLRRERRRAASPNVSGAGSYGGEPQAVVDSLEDVIMTLQARGFSGRPLHTGAYLRDLDGKLIKTSARAPRSTRGRDGRLQVQNRKTIKSSADRLVPEAVTIPLDWAEIEASKDQDLVLTSYAECDGFWSYRSQRVLFTKAATSGDLAGVVIAGDTRIDVERAIRAGELGVEEALFMAAAEGEDSVLDFLLKSGADVRARGEGGRLPLHEAARSGHEKTVAKLVQADTRRAEIENAEAPLEPNFDTYLARSCPTLEARDGMKRTALHHAAAAGRVEVVKTLIGAGADRNAQDEKGLSPAELAEANDHDILAKAIVEDGVAELDIPPPAEDEPTDEEISGGYETPFVERVERDDPASRVAPLVGPLREWHARFERSAKPIMAMPAAAKDDPKRLKKAGEAMIATVEDFGEFVRASYPNLHKPGVRRFTYAELEIIERIANVHEQAGNHLLEVSGIKDLHAESKVAPAKRQRIVKQLAEDAARQIATNALERWSQEKGLEHIFFVDGQKTILGSARKQLDLNLKRMVDRHAEKAYGIPIGGLRSFQSLFRLTARKKVKDWIASLVLDVTSNRLILRLVQDQVLYLLEKELWPAMREAFRHKAHLDRRVRISVGTLRDTSAAMNRMVENRDALVYDEVFALVRRGKGALHAMRYLEKDLKRAGREDLIKELAKAKATLERDLRRFQMQWVIADLDIFDRFGDQFARIDGNHAGMEKLVKRLGEEKEEPLVAGFELVCHHPKPGFENHRGRGTPGGPQFQVHLQPIPPKPPEWIEAEVGGKRYRAYGYAWNDKYVRYDVHLPLPPGDVQVTFRCPGAKPLIVRGKQRPADPHYREQAISARKKQHSYIRFASKKRGEDRRRAEREIINGWVSVAHTELFASECEAAKRTLEAVLSKARGLDDAWARRNFNQELMVARYISGDQRGYLEALDHWMKDTVAFRNDPNRRKRASLGVCAPWAAMALACGSEEHARALIKLARDNAIAQGRNPDRHPKGWHIGNVNNWLELRGLRN